MTGDASPVFGLRCLFCDSQRTIVIDSRPVRGTVRRRRLCKACGERFWTGEFYTNERCELYHEAMKGKDDG